MLTAIYTEQTTQLSIEANEPICLEQMNGSTRELEAGIHKLTIGPGLFRVLSEHPVVATAPGESVRVWAEGKDGPLPQGPRVLGTLDPQTTAEFLAARSHEAPQ